MNFNRFFFSTGVLVSWTVASPAATLPLFASETQTTQSSEAARSTSEASAAPSLSEKPISAGEAATTIPGTSATPAATDKPIPATPAADPPAVTKTAPPETPVKVMATHLVLDTGKRRVYAYKDKEVLASYPVAVGKKGWETPKGNFKVIQMVINPVWKNPWNGKVSASGPNSPLGERWIGFWTNGKNTIGFHGTPTVKSIGSAASHGCVRMFNKDVKALYEIVSHGTPVTVK